MPEGKTAPIGGMYVTIVAKITVATIDGNKLANCTIEVKSKSSRGGNTGGTGGNHSGGGSGGGSSLAETIKKDKLAITESLIKLAKSNLTLNAEIGILSGKVDEKDLKLAESIDSTNTNKNGDIVIEFESISSINGYGLHIPVSILNKETANKSIIIKTNIVSLNYKPEEEELKNPDSIVVYYIDGFGKTNVVSNGRFDPATNQVTFYTTHFSKYVIAYVKMNYKDLGKVKWAEKEINAMSSKGIIRNNGNDRFNPLSNITRAEFIYGLVKVMGFTTKAEDNFNDISITDYYYDEIAIAKKLGIASGIGNNNFTPSKNITRQDMMTLITRALKTAGKIEITNYNNLDGFIDSNLIAPYAKESVSIVVDKGIIIGDRESIKPLDYTTRAEIAIILYRIYTGL